MATRNPRLARLRATATRKANAIKRGAARRGVGSITKVRGGGRRGLAGGGSSGG